MNRTNTTTIKNHKSKGILAYYKAYIDKQKEHRFLSLMLSILVFSRVIIIPIILLIAVISYDPVWFISLGVLLFYAKVIMHLAKYNSRQYIPIRYIATAFIVMTLIIIFLIKFYSS